MTNECVAGEGGWEERIILTIKKNICLTNLEEECVEKEFLERGMVLSVYLFVYVH